jgi:hypothetical protein
MSSIRPYVLRTLVAGAALLASPALAVVQSSCPAPCAKLPRYAIFGRETGGHLDANGYLVDLVGTLAKGIRKTIVRVDASVNVEGGVGFNSLYVSAYLNGKSAGGVGTSGYGTACASTHPYCTVTATIWFDIDALEATYPGQFVGQPLTVSVGGGALTGSGAGRSYWASFDAQVVKNR